jgi:hypothetical protein
MKKLFSTLIISLTTLTLFGQTLDEIVKKHIEAIGGKDNWAKVKSLKTIGTLKAQGAEITITIQKIDKTASRQDIALMGMKGYNILTTTEGWNFMPFQGQTKPEPITPDDVKKSQEDLYLMPDLMTYKEFGKKLEYLGMDDFDGTECFKLKMIDKEKKETTFFIDPSNYYIIKKVSKLTVNGKEIESETIMSNYKKQDNGIVYPFSFVSGWGETEITVLEINPKIDESIFKVTK